MRRLMNEGAGVTGTFFFPDSCLIARDFKSFQMTILTLWRKVTDLQSRC